MGNNIVIHEGRIEKANFLPIPISKFKHGDPVCIIINGTSITGKVTKVSFTRSKVFYDVEIIVDKGYATRFHSIDSAFVSSAFDTPVETEATSEGRGRIEGALNNAIMVDTSRK